MDVSPLPVRDPKRAAALCGNAMAFSVVGVVQMVALSSFSFAQD